MAEEIDSAGRPGDTAVVSSPEKAVNIPLPGFEIGKSVKDVPADVISETVRDVPKQGTVKVPGTNTFQETLIWFVGQAADEFEPWGQRNNKARDKQLRQFIPTESMFSSALGIVIVRNAGFDWEIQGDTKTAQRVHEILTEANMGLGWVDLISKVSIDLYTQDSGAFIEVVRDGEGFDAPFIGLNHLDAARCYHTGDPLKPVIYQDVQSKYHLLEWWNVVTLAEMPTAVEGLYGLQFCAETRLMLAAQIMKNIAIYKKEKSGGRNTRAIQLIQGITTETINDAIQDLRNRADSQGFMRYMQPVIIGSHDPQATIDVKTLELVSLPDGFDEDTAFRHYLNMIAMAFGSDYQEFAPLPGGNLGTSMQSEILHAKNRGKGPGMFMKLIVNAMNQRILPRNVKFAYAEMDLEAEESQATIGKLRAETRKIQLESTEINQAEARQIAVDAGDLPQELFDRNPGGDITPVERVVSEGEPHHAKEEDEDREPEVSPPVNPFGSVRDSTGIRATKFEPARAGPFEEDRLIAERRLTLAIRRAFKKHFEAVKKQLRKEKQQETRGQRSVGSKAIGDVADDVQFWGLRKAEFMAEVGDQPLELLLQGGQQAQALGLAVDMTLVNTEALQFTQQFTNRWWEELSAQTRNNMRTAVSTFIQTDQPLRVLNKNLEPLFGIARAEVVARTEVTRMYAEGNRIAYSQAGIREVEWRTVSDALVDPVCDELDKKRMPLGQESIVPPAHPRCRCWIAPVVCTEEKGTKAETCNALLERVDQETVPSIELIPDLGLPSIPSLNEIEDWVQARVFISKVRKESLNILRKGKMTKQTAEHRLAGSLLQGVRDGRKFKELYRGIKLSEADAVKLMSDIKSGKEIKHGLTSFSKSQEQASLFSEGGAARPVGVDIIATDVRGLDLTFSAADFYEEVILAGNLKVVSITRVGDRITLLLKGV